MSVLPPSLAEFIRDEHMERAREHLASWAQEMRRGGYDNTALAQAAARAILALCDELPEYDLMQVANSLYIAVGDVEEAADRYTAHVIVADPAAVLADAPAPTPPERIDEAEGRMLSLIHGLRQECLRSRSLVRALNAFLFDLAAEEPFELLCDLCELFHQAFVYDEDVSQSLAREAGRRGEATLLQ